MALGVGFKSAEVVAEARNARFAADAEGQYCAVEMPATAVPEAAERGGAVLASAVEGNPRGERRRRVVRQMDASPT